MHKVLMLQPPRIVIGPESSHQCIADLLERDLRRIFFVTSKSTRGFAEEMALSLAAEGAQTCIESGIHGEPDISSFESVLSAARSFTPSAVIGIGGGSVLDVAKLVAALLLEKRSVREFFGIGLLPPRQTWLACLPTTAGTGSEVSPNTILLDEAAHLKKGVISPHLVPDAAYIEPRYMASLPPFVTAVTGMDALTHCIEAFANRFAHPAVDAYALAGIRLIAENLPAAIEQPGNLAVREKMAIGGLYGGLCLGPVNTAGVHALSYPLGGRFHVPHGAANALLLPHVIEFTLPAAPDRYAAIAETMGLHLKTAREGVNHIRILAQRSGLPMRMRDWNVPQSAIPEMADAAMEVTRLLKNNLREITRKDALEIYKQAW
jgi:alcohol dehydrogenase class IV